MRPKWLDQMMKVNKELLLIFSIMAFAGIINFFVTGQKLVLAFYDLPTLFAAYYFGRARAVQTALASVLIVCWLNVLHPTLPASGTNFASRQLLAWSDVAIWGGFLLITAYAMGTLYLNNEKSREDLRTTRVAMVGLLDAVIHSEHSGLGSAILIAGRMGLSAEEIEDIRATAVLRDLSKSGPGRCALEQISGVSDEELTRGLPQENGKPVKVVNQTLRRTVPMLLNRFSASARGNIVESDETPLALRILKVAESYDSLVTDSSSRKGLLPREALAVMAKKDAQSLDPKIVTALESALKLEAAMKNDPREIQKVLA